MNPEHQIHVTDLEFWLILFAVVALLLLPRLLPRLLLGLGVYLSPQEVKSRLDAGDELVLLDVRTPSEYLGELGHIRGAELLPLSELSAATADEAWVTAHTRCPVVLICRTDLRAGIAARKLRRAGLEKVMVMGGGMQAWRDDLFPVEREGRTNGRSSTSD